MVLNELAQGLRPAAEGVEWFESLSEDEQRKILHALVLFCGQARACEEDVPESIARSGIRPTHTPAVMLTKWRFGMEGLPAYELTKSFHLLVALFSIADTRRRTLHCVGGCGHEWHNLSDPQRKAT
jgi:DMSO/TMAO reductase YedYZ molybdopterin-dependent catalytic subunit